MKYDFHLHTNFSTDSDTKPREMIEQALELGLKHICITDHQDWDFPVEKYHMDFLFDTNEYFEAIHKLQEEFRDKIKISIGVELGLQKQLVEKYQEYTKAFPFDYIIGSIHLVNGIDPYYSEFFQERNPKEAYMEYFEASLENAQLFDCYDSFGHLDYIFRYGPEQVENYFTYEEYKDIIDAILSELIKKDKALEINTAGFKYGLNHPNPHEDIIKRYKEMGGQLITVGSDGHRPDHLAYAFDRITPLLISCGFNHINVYEARKVQFIDIR